MASRTATAVRSGSRRRTPRSVQALPAGAVALFEQDAELRGVLKELSGAPAQAAANVLLDSWELCPGPWEPLRNPLLAAADRGYLMLDGLLLCRVRVGIRSSAELLGRGDVFRVDDLNTNGYETVGSQESFRVLVSARLVVLEHRLVAKLGSVPGVASWLQRSWARRERSLLVRLAIVQEPNLTIRLQLLLWHLADRCGSRCPDGVRIPFRLTHEVLAESVSARRSSVSTAIHKLEAQGAIERNPEGHWILRTEPPWQLQSGPAVGVERLPAGRHRRSAG